MTVIKELLKSMKEQKIQENPYFRMIRMSFTQQHL